MSARVKDWIIGAAIAVAVYVVMWVINAVIPLPRERREDHA